MWILAASRNGASAVLTALLISNLKRCGRSAAPWPLIDVRMAAKSLPLSWLARMASKRSPPTVIH